MKTKKDFWINLQENVNFVKTAGKQLVELQYFDWNLTTGMCSLIENLDMLLLLNLKDDVNCLTRLIYTMKLLLNDNSRITNRKKLLFYIYKTYLNLVTNVVNYKQF